MSIRLILHNTPAGDITPMPKHPTTDFVEAALHTAKHSKAKERNAILSDVCDVLNCHPEGLNFLFEHHIVPTQNRPVFGLELPDYRMSQSEIYKEAAE